MEVDGKMGFAPQEFANFAGIHAMHQLVESFDWREIELTLSQLLDIIRCPEGIGHVSLFITVASTAEFFRGDV